MSIFGPLAGMYGRDIEQYLMRLGRGLLIPDWNFNESVHGVNWTLQRNALTKYYYQDQSSNQSETSSVRWD